MMLLTEGSLIYRGIRPLQKLGATAREIAVNNPFIAIQQKAPVRLNVVPPDPWAGDAQRGRDMVAGVFRFAGQVIEKENLSWQPQGARPEWVAELHGFEWLRDLRSVGGDRARRMAREMAASWLSSYDKPHDIAWRADITGVRLAAWITFHDFFCASADDAFREQYFASLVKQAKHLARHLPGDLSGIPLIRALKGLAYTGLALDEGEKRLEYAFKLILQEIRHQILPDGAHVSRSPQATFEFLQVLVDLRTALTAARLDIPDDLQHAIDRIAPAVKFYRHADGALCQFNGGQECNGSIIEATLMHSGARGKAMKSLPHAGYDRITLGRSSLVMDVGAAQSRTGRRAHAGLLSFEYSYGKDRVFVNCGTSDAPGKWRELLRSTAAHTALVAEHRNSCPFDDWGLMSGHLDIKHRNRADEDMAVIEATHNGYMPRFGLMHARIVQLLEGGDVLAGEERLQGRSGLHFAVRFHLHPSIQASAIQDGTEILLRAKSGTGWRFRCAGARLDIEDSVYMSEGETPRRTLQIALNGMTEGTESSVTWELRRDKI